MNEYRTSDIGFAAALKSLGFEFISTERKDQKRFDFVFDVCEEDIEQIQRDYSNHRLPLPDALAMHEAIKSLKAQLGASGAFNH